MLFRRLIPDAFLDELAREDEVGGVDDDNDGVDDEDDGVDDAQWCVAACNAAAGSRIRSSRSLLRKTAIVLGKLLAWKRNIA